MPMEHAWNQYRVGDKLNFFHSQAPGEARCLVFAHGGHLWGDDNFFVLPAGLRLSFTQKSDGKALTSSPRTAIANKPGLGSTEDFVGRVLVKQYSLGKAVGKAWDKKTTVDYLAIEQLMAAQLNAQSFWTPHVVTVSRRYWGLGRLIMLGELVTQITAFAAGRNIPINHFYIAACRGDLTKKRFVSTVVRV